MDQGNHNDFVGFQINRNIINLAKSFLIILEDLKLDNVISEEYYQKIRKRVLSDSNDRIRDLQKILEDLEIRIRKK